jgi:CPA2 family monovalent cation:H+ antiporter-2
MEALGSYDDILVVLAAAGIIIPIFRKLGISSVLGFLIVGILIGPSVLGQLISRYPWLEYFTISNRHEIGRLADLGIAFLMFMIGLELSFERLVTLRRLVFGLGSLQVIASSLVLGGCIYALGSPAREAAVLGAALSLSSTAIVVQLLSDEKRLGSPTGRRAFSILLFQDLAVIPMLLLVNVLGGKSDGLVFSEIALAILQAVLAMIVIVVIGRYLLRPLLRLVAQTRSPDLFMAATLFIAVGTGVAATVAGLSMAMGAFVAGLLLAETEFRREIEVIIEPFRGLMLGAFFLLVGMSINLADVLANPIAILLFATALIAIKAAVLMAAGAVMRLAPGAMLETALLLGPGGEFAFVILADAKTLGVISPGANETALVVVSISMLALPVFARLGRRVSKRLVRSGTLPPEALDAPPSEGGRVIVVGFGRVGKLIGSMIEDNQLPYIAVDADPVLVARERRNGKPIYYGDAARIDFLRACGIGEAQALAITVNSSTKTDEILIAARRERSDLKIIVRARDEKHAAHLYELGATEAVPETIEAALQLGEAVLVEAGVPMGLAIASVHERRDQIRKLLGLPNRREELARLNLRRAHGLSRSNEQV